jgi:hypothetical protein
VLAHDHDYFLEGCVSGTFAQSIDGTFYLTRSVDRTVDRIGSGQSQVIMAVAADVNATESVCVLATPPVVMLPASNPTNANILAPE